MMDHNPTEFADIIIVFIIQRKLDGETLSWWDRYVNSQVPDTNSFPTLQQMLKFLRDHSKTISQGSFENNIKKRNERESFGHQERPKQVFNTDLRRKVFKCLKCADSHPLYKCQGFLDLSPGKRKEFVLNKNLCPNCLSSTHTLEGCKSNFKCRQCQQNHNSLIHLELPVKVDAIPQCSNRSSLSGFTQFGQMEVLLSTALIKVKTNSNRIVVCRALIDSGSQTSIITQECFDRLGLRSKETNINLVGIDSTYTTNVLNQTIIKYGSRFEKVQPFSTSLMILPTFNKMLPYAKVHLSDVNRFKGLRLADPNFQTPGKIDILLGALEYVKKWENKAPRNFSCSG